MPTVLLQRPPTSHQAPSHQDQVHTSTTKCAAQGSSLPAALYKGCPLQGEMVFFNTPTSMESILLLEHVVLPVAG
jgi:hypothetical protein